MLANVIFGLRVSAEEELLGADYTEHGIGKERAYQLRNIRNYVKIIHSRKSYRQYT